MHSLEEHLLCRDWMNIYDGWYTTALNVILSILYYRHSTSRVDCDVKSGTTCPIWSQIEILAPSGTFRDCPEGKSRDLVPETHFFLLANDSTPLKMNIYICYMSKSAKWSLRYVGFRVWGVRGVNPPPKGGKRGRKIGTRLDSVYWTPIGPKKLEIPKWTCKMSMMTYRPRL